MTVNIKFLNRISGGFINVSLFAIIYSTGICDIYKTLTEPTESFRCVF